MRWLGGGGVAHLSKGRNPYNGREVSEVCECPIGEDHDEGRTDDHHPVDCDTNECWEDRGAVWRFSLTIPWPCPCLCHRRVRHESA